MNFDEIWKTVIATAGHAVTSALHGPSHWRRVELNACVLAARTGANVDVVRLFAVFHDSKRVNDGWDPEHGQRGADFAATLRGKLFELPDDDFTLLQYACVWHTDGVTHPAPTIGTCWDADRLDLGRVWITPSAKYMSTTFAAEIATHGDIQPWVHLAEPVLGCRGSKGKCIGLH